MKLNIYETQSKVAKTYEVEAYDLMYGTVEDIFDIMESVGDVTDTEKLLAAVQKNRERLNELLLDIFADQGLTREELRRIKVKELIPLFVDLFTFVSRSFSKN